MISNRSEGLPPRPGDRDAVDAGGPRLGALADYAARAHDLLGAHDPVGGPGSGGARERLARVAGLLRPLILESWVRGVEDGLDPMEPLGARGLRGADLRRYRETHPLAALLPLVDALLVQDAVRAGLVVGVADRFGRMLWVHGDADRVAAAAAAGLRPGDDLSERRVGANAVGLVVRTGRAAWVHGPEHFLHRMHTITGAAAPVRDPDGRPVGVLLIAGGARVATPEILALVKAAATVVEKELLLAALRTGRDGAVAVPRRGPEVDDVDDAEVGEVLSLDVLGSGPPRLTMGADRIVLSQRHAEILVLLAEHPEGMGADHLATQLDDTDLDNGTIRAAISRLRAVVGPAIFGSRPYRLRRHLATDVEAVRAALDSGDIDSASRLYVGPVLPRSTAPGIVDIRDELRVRLRFAVLGAGDAEVLRRWTASPEGRDDAAAWTAYRATVEPGSALYAQVEARIRVLDRRLGADATRMQRPDS